MGMCRSLMGRPAEVLLVDDNFADAYLTKECFKNIRYPVNLHHVECGEQCLAFLRKEGNYGLTPDPDLVLLDLNMPRMDGWQVMEEVLTDERLRHLPVVVLTTSANAADVLRMHKLRCNSYIVKPMDLGKFQSTIQSLCDYWFSTALLPSIR